ncbi:MAG: mycothiol synthase [Acidimicrobiales bacterium]
MSFPITLHGPVHRLEHGERDSIEALIHRLHPAIRHAPLGDATWRTLVSGAGPDYTAAWASRSDHSSPDSTVEVVAYAQVTRLPADEVWVAELVIDPAHQERLVDLGAPLLSRALKGSGQHTHYWVSDPTPAHLEVVARLDLHHHRLLHQMKCPLPLQAPAELRGLVTRPFEVGRDEASLLEVNRRAFATHPDQGRMTAAQLQQRIEEPWFDPEGCLLSEIDGQLAGFCWTKLFRDYQPVMGEIHIIGVDPAFAGRGLGPRLVVAGLEHLASRGAGEGVLFVEGDNEAARAMYDRLGFVVTRTDRAFATSLHG